MTIINVDDATAQLDALIDRAASGEEIVLARGGHPIAQILPRRAEPKPTPAAPRVGGQLEGKIWIAPDFDEWTDELDEMFGMKG